jgi:uncharacterized protein involved in exopolysaccharide biosynthesis
MRAQMDKIELGDLIALVALSLGRRWRWALVSVLLVNLAALIAVFSIKPTYEVSTVVEPSMVGRNTTGQFGVSIPAADLLKTISSDAAHDSIRADLGLSNLPRLAFQTAVLGEEKQTRSQPHYAVWIACETTDPDLGTAALSSLISACRAQMRPATEKMRQSVEEEAAIRREERDKALEAVDAFVKRNAVKMKWYEKTIAKMEDRLGRLDREIEDLDRDSQADPASAASQDGENGADGLEALRNEQAELAVSLEEHRQIVADYERELSFPLRSQAETANAEMARLEALLALQPSLTVVSPPTVSPAPVRPRRGLILAICLFLSVVLSAIGTTTVDILQRRLGELKGASPARK